MRKNLILAIATLAIALAGCSKSEETPTESLNGEIRLSSGVTTLTRASFGMDTQIASGQSVAVYVDNSSDAPIYGNNILTANGSGGLTGTTSMYFPADKTAVSIYAIHTNGTLDALFPTSPITHTVSADQTAATGYATSDLLYATSTAVAFTKTAIPLTFYHLLSKVEVALKAGNGTPDLTGATVSIVGTQLKANFIPVKTITMTSQELRGSMITTPTNDNDATAIQIGATVSTDFEAANIAYNEAIIVPQTVAQGDQFIQIKLANGSDLFYKMETATTFESGKRYQYKITANLSGLTATSIVSDWIPVNPVTGNAEIE